MTRQPGNWCGRPIKCELNVFSKPEGSAILSQGDTVVLAALYGPHELKHVKIQAEEPAFEVNLRTKTGAPSNAGKSREDLIKSACESVFFPKKFTRHSLTLVVHETQDNGGLLSCAINAGCLAMLNSGIDMQHLVVAVCCCIASDNTIIIDPVESQLTTAKMTMDVAFETVNYEIVMINSEGAATTDLYKNAIEACREASKDLTQYFRSVVEKYSTVLFAV